MRRVVKEAAYKRRVKQSRRRTKWWRKRERKKWLSLIKIRVPIK